MSLTEQYAQPRRQYQPVPTNDSNSFELYDYSAQSSHRQPAAPPNRGQQQQPAFSSNNPFRRAPPPPISQPTGSHHHAGSVPFPSEESFGSTAEDANTRNYLSAARNADPSFRSHSASNLESQPQAPKQLPPPQTRNQIYQNVQFSASDQSVLGSRGPQLQPRKRDIPSFISHSSNESTSSVSSSR